MAEALRRLTGPLEPEDQAHMLEDPRWSPAYSEVVTHIDGTPVSLEALEDLMRETTERIDGGVWQDDRAAADRWLAPRVHWALRLTRAQASDGGLWLWAALRYADVVAWRWGDGDVAEVAKDRWTGGVHKQALARLWWGGELFRNGPDYGPVVRAFVRQDLPNSYLHRPLVRCRPLALALLDVIAPEGQETSVSADEVNDLARALNLGTAGSPPEAEIGGVEDFLGQVTWASTDALVPSNWEMLPYGPLCSAVLPDELERAAAVTERCIGWARAAAEASGSRSAERRARRDSRADLSQRGSGSAEVRARE